MTKNPTWDESIELLFSKPYWVDKPEKIAAGWHACMVGYAMDLTSYDSVKNNQVNIYDHLRSRSMPLTNDASQFWPNEALALFRLWVNQGSRKSGSDKIEDLDIIPLPDEPVIETRLRKNIAYLSEQELNQYRAALDAYGATDTDIENSPWQIMAAIHSDWCLHYQEAFLLWHRAFILYFEQQIGMAVPYWNWMSPNVSKLGDPEAGLPQAFIDKTYKHPETGEVRPNPLRYAIARNGRSKACEGGHNEIPDDQCQYVQRDPVFYTTGEDSKEKRQQKFNLLNKFQRQVSEALMWPVFSTPQGSPGYPWANIPTFDPPPPDRDYPHKCDFDGRYEQPHDNYHGWSGPDMADNAYTAYDPIFWSLHSNIDRVYEGWLRKNTGAQYTANFPIRPFIGNEASSVRFDDSREFVYTTIGDLAKDSRALGYDFEAPKYPDAGGNNYEPWKDFLYIIFDGVRCTFDTYYIDVFINLPDPKPEDKDNKNSQHYVGRFTRLGMGIKDDKGRCVKQGVTRILDGSYNAFYLGLKKPDGITCNLLVSDISGNIVPPEIYEKLPGFIAKSVWTSGPRQGDIESAEECCPMSKK